MDITRTLLRLTTVSLTAIATVPGVPNSDLEQLREQIKHTGAQWKAGATAVSKLSWEEKERLCGLLFAERPGMSSTTTDATTTSTSESFDPIYDWRLQGKVTPVKDQGGCGSCWAFAAVGAMESVMLIADQSLRTADLDMSEQLVVSCDDGNYGCCGGYMNVVYDFLVNAGTADEACMVYDPSGSCRCSPRWCMSKTMGCEEKCTDWTSRAGKLSAWQWVNATAVVPTVDELKAEVASGPVPVGMDVYDDFFHYTGGVYEHVTGELAGGHAVVIVGWEDPDTQCPDGRWIVKNSWGASWGEAGFFRIKWGDSRIGMDAAVLSYAATVCADGDGDGHSDMACGGTDCNDADAAIQPDAAEVCDGVDNDCDGRVDEGFTKYTYYLDSDGDGYGDSAAALETCGEAPVDYIARDSDCDDNNFYVNPGAAEVCDGIDNNCDGRIDEGLSMVYYRDNDGDGYGDPNVTEIVCNGQSAPVGHVTVSGDCDDADPAVHPEAVEACGDGVDNDCDGRVDEDCAPSCLDKGTLCDANTDCCSGRCLPSGKCR